MMAMEPRPQKFRKGKSGRASGTGEFQAAGTSCGGGVADEGSGYQGDFGLVDRSSRE